MKFLRVVAVMAIVGFGSVNAEQSGGFVGGDLGYGNLNIPFSYGTKTERRDTEYMMGEYKGSGATIAVVGGYKQFFTPYFGLRYYGNIGVTIGKVSPKGIDKNGDINIDLRHNRSIMRIDYTANVDLLANFIVREKNKIADFGAFLGLGLGGSSWSGDIMDDIDKHHLVVYGNKFNDNNIKIKRNFFNLLINVGLRATIYTNHGIELSCIIPSPLADDIFIKKDTPPLKISQKNAFNVALRYTYTFGEPRKVITKVVKKRKRPSIEERLQEEAQTPQKREDSKDMNDEIRELEKELGDI